MRLVLGKQRHPILKRKRGSEIPPRRSRVVLEPSHIDGELAQLVGKRHVLADGSRESRSQDQNVRAAHIGKGRASLLPLFGRLHWESHLIVLRVARNFGPESTLLIFGEAPGYRGSYCLDERHHVLVALDPAEGPLGFDHARTDPAPHRRNQALKRSGVAIRPRPGVHTLEAGYS